MSRSGRRHVALAALPAALLALTCAAPAPGATAPGAGAPARPDVREDVRADAAPRGPGGPPPHVVASDLTPDLMEV
ncbi:hypothetical protein ACFXB3_21870, partial [Streptomyces sp. NPDC059447]|uniref:hypothetical protein n=1 Tax=Streptomyces sp. NPDC059447 TaxID=3346834 RepID=UPI0036829B4F